MTFSCIRPFFYSFILVTTLWGTPVHADTLDVKAPISDVIVFADRAAITRTAAITLPAGAHVISISDLPAGLIPSSLKATGTSTGGSAIIGAIRSKMMSSAELAAPRERDLNDQIIKLQDERALIVADEQATKARLDFLSKIGAAATTRTNEEMAKTLTLKPDEWIVAADKLYTSTRDALKTSEGYAVTLRDIDKKIKALQDELNSLKTGNTQSYQVQVPVEVASANTSLTLLVEYQLFGAGWTPIYDARLNTKTADVDLVQYGSVQQSTGEDWANVKLTLSTARPSEAATPPALFPLWLRIIDPAQFGMLQEGIPASAPMMAKAMRRNEMVAADSAEMAAGTAVTAPQSMEVRAAQIETGGYTANYRVPGLMTVMADGSAQKALIQNLKTSSRLMAQVMPALSDQAYIVARLTLGGDQPFLPGSINLFRDNTFIGESFHDLMRSGQEMDLAFGVDDKIAVKRSVLADKAGTAGIISGSKTMERLVRTDIQNLHTFDIALEVKESVPVSADKRITVTLNDKDTTKGFTADEKKDPKGVYTWPLTLKPNEKASIQLGYTASWPADLNIQGLP